MTIPTVLTIDERTSYDDYQFDPQSGLLMAYIEYVDEWVDDHCAAHRVYLPVEHGPVCPPPVDMSGYDYWYMYDESVLIYTYVWAGTHQLPGYGPEVIDEVHECWTDSDLILLHGPQPA